MRLDAATFLLQWSTGGLAFLWFTLRSKEISLGYSKLLRATYGVLAMLGAVAGFYFDGVLIREIASVTVALVAFATIANKSSKFDLVAVAVGAVCPVCAGAVFPGAVCPRIVCVVDCLVPTWHVADQPVLDRTDRVAARRPARGAPRREYEASQGRAGFADRLDQGRQARHRARCVGRLVDACDDDPCDN